MKRKFKIKFKPAKRQMLVIQEALCANDYDDDMNNYTFVLTDPAFKQCHIELGNDVWLYSQNDYGEFTEDNKAFYSDEWRAEIGRFSSYTDEEVEDMVSSHYESLADLKEACGDSWKMIALECGFENCLL